MLVWNAGRDVVLKVGLELKRIIVSPANINCLPQLVHVG